MRRVYENNIDGVRGGSTKIKLMEPKMALATINISNVCWFYKKGVYENLLPATGGGSTKNYSYRRRGVKFFSEFRQISTHLPRSDIK